MRGSLLFPTYAMVTEVKRSSCCCTCRLYCCTALFWLYGSCAIRLEFASSDGVTAEAPKTGRGSAAVARLLLLLFSGPWPVKVTRYPLVAVNSCTPLKPGLFDS